MPVMSIEKKVLKLEDERGDLLDQARAIYEPALDKGKSLEDGDRERLKNIDEAIKEKDEEIKKANDDLALMRRVAGYDRQMAKGQPQRDKKAAGTIGEQFVNAEAFQKWFSQIAPNGRIPDSTKGLSSPAIPIEGLDIKTLVTGQSDTSAGAMIDTDVTGIYEPLGRYPVSVLDLISRRQTTSDVVSFVRQTAQITQAAAVAEATASSGSTGTKAEGAMAFLRVTANVKPIAVWVPATKMALADAAQLRGIIDEEIRADLQEELCNQVLNGNGSDPNFTGIYNTSGILAQSYVTDKLTTTRKAITNIRTNGKVSPTAWVMHPNDWEAFELLKNSDGDYYHGGPFGTGPNTLWRVPVVESYFATEGTPLLGAWRRSASIWDRQQTTISVSDSHSDFFIRNLVAILGELRAAFGVLRATGFVSVSMSAS